MTPEERIVHLERQMIETRRAAIAIIMGMAEGVAPTPEGREKLAQGFDEAAEGSEGEIARLARLAAGALRER